MDIFSTTVTAGAIIYRFLDACGEFSSDAKSLAARFNWDLTALTAIREHFQERKLRNVDGGLPEDQRKLLQTTADYLDGLADEIQKSLRKIERGGWLENKVNRLMWVARESDLRKIQQELEYWTDRFGIRVLALPREVRNVIDASVDAANAPTLVKSNRELLEYTRLATNSAMKQKLAMEMLSRDSTGISRRIANGVEVSFLPMKVDGSQMVFATRPILRTVKPGSTEFEKLKLDMGMLAAALNFISPTADVSLLRVEFCFYHADSCQFFFAHIPPYEIISMMTLARMIRREEFPHTTVPLGERLKLAYKLAEAVVFLHAAGFLHKNITSLSAVALRRAEPFQVDALSADDESTILDQLSIRDSATYKKQHEPSLDEVYLMGFDLVRSTEARTSKEGAVDYSKDEISVPIWERDIYMHPERQRGKNSLRYQKTHDVYSLGVVLLEVGMWQTLSSITDRAKQDIWSTGHDDGNIITEKDDRNTWPAKLRSIATEPTGLAARVGKRYQAIIEWCLGLSTDDGMDVTEFVQNVLDPLEEMVHAVSRND